MNVLAEFMLYVCGISIVVMLIFYVYLVKTRKPEIKHRVIPKKRRTYPSK